MPPDLACLSPSTSSLAAIDNASLQLRRVAERLVDARVLVGRLAAATDWQTPSARGFFALAARLAADVAGLGSLTEAVMGDIALARARVSVENPWDCR